MLMEYNSELVHKRSIWRLSRTPAVDLSHVTVVHKLPFDFAILSPPDGVKNSSTFVCTLTTRFARDCIVRDDSRTSTPAQCRWHSSRSCTSDITTLRALYRMGVSIGTPTGADCQFISGSTVSRNNNICQHCTVTRV